MEKINLFVYGTLMSDQSRGNAIPQDLVSSRIVAHIHAEGLYFNKQGEFPLAVVNNKNRSANKKKIVGEVITLKDKPVEVGKLLIDLDRIEGAGNLFYRDSCMAYPGVGASISCIFYNLGPNYRNLIISHYNEIKSGDYREYVLLRERFKEKFSVY